MAACKDRDFRSRMRSAAQDVERALNLGLGLGQRDLPPLKLSKCCPAGQPHCEQCLLNYCFRLGSPQAALSDDSLIEAVAEGDKPVGLIPLTAEDTSLCSYLENKGLSVLLSYASPKWQCWLTVFCAKPELTLASLVDCSNLKKAVDIRLDPRSTIRDLATIECIEEGEGEDPLVLALIMGLPIWFCLSWRHVLNPKFEPVKVVSMPPPPPKFPKVQVGKKSARAKRAEKRDEKPNKENEGEAKSPSSKGTPVVAAKRSPDKSPSRRSVRSRRTEGTET